MLNRRRRAAWGGILAAAAMAWACETRAESWEAGKIASGELPEGWGKYTLTLTESGPSGATTVSPTGDRDPRGYGNGAVAIEAWPRATATFLEGFARIWCERHDLEPAAAGRTLEEGTVRGMRVLCSTAAAPLRAWPGKMYQRLIFVQATDHYLCIAVIAADDRRAAYIEGAERILDTLRIGGQDLPEALPPAEAEARAREMRAALDGERWDEALAAADELLARGGTGGREAVVAAFRRADDLPPEHPQFARMLRIRARTDARGIAAIRRILQGRDPAAAASAAEALTVAPPGQAVPLLLAVLDEEGVAPAAQESLRILTGQTLDGRAAWTAWWTAHSAEAGWP